MFIWTYLLGISGVPRGVQTPPVIPKCWHSTKNLENFTIWNEISCTKLQLPPEPLTRGPLPPDPRSLRPQMNLLNPPPPNKIHGYATARNSPYYHLLKYLLFLLKHPVYRRYGCHPDIWLRACSSNGVIENGSHICKSCYIFMDSFLWHSNLLIMYTNYIHMWWTILEEIGDFFPSLFGASLKLVRKVTSTKVQFTENIIHVTPCRLWVLALKFFAVCKLFSILFFQLSKNMLKMEN
jgi:hypothetical protein